MNNETQDDSSQIEDIKDIESFEDLATNDITTNLKIKSDDNDSLPANAFESISELEVNNETQDDSEENNDVESPEEMATNDSTINFEELSTEPPAMIASTAIKEIIRSLSFKNR